MNPRLASLEPYPFERLRGLLGGVTPLAVPPIRLSIGEPQFPTPPLIGDALTAHLSGLSVYPLTAGQRILRDALAAWFSRRYQLPALDPETQVLPVNGSREALFAFAQAVVDGSRPAPLVVSPNPFYQIYEGAAILGGATPYYAPSDPALNFNINWDRVSDRLWANTQLVYVCSPGNPTGAVMPMSDWEKLFRLSERYDFVIASDECYSEIYFRDEAPLGSLEAAERFGLRDFKNLVMFTSLSKRSNVPGMRSGFVAGDARFLKQFLLYRTYHGSAVSGMVQAASIAAWNDEAHVLENRALYRQKFSAVTPMLSAVMDVRLPDAGFYLWAGVPGGNDEVFARELLAQYNVTVLPGSYLARHVQGVNPGAGRVRMALVAGTEECVEAAKRIVDFVKGKTG